MYGQNGPAGTTRARATLVFETNASNGLGRKINVPCGCASVTIVLNCPMRVLAVFLRAMTSIQKSLKSYVDSSVAINNIDLRLIQG